jgi:predicted TIM-barrel fold metal-dependent hydrolase
MKIDIFTHIIPQKYLDALVKKKPSINPVLMTGTKNLPTLTNIESRLRIMDNFDDLAQVLTIAGILSEGDVRPQDEVELAQIANDEMAEIVIKYPDRFLGAVAALPLSDLDAALKETDRAINDLKFKGVQIFTDISGEPLDSVKFRPLYKKMADYDLPIWIHPRTRSGEPDYVGGKTTDYFAFMFFTWPYQTTLAMNRLVFGEILEDYPNLKFITHHGGGMIPYFAERVSGRYDYNQVILKGVGFERQLKKPPIEYFRRFYADTAHEGSTLALMCVYSFFGAEHTLFGTDMPYDNEYGLRLIRETIRSIERMDISEADKVRIFEGNARQLLHLLI